MKIEKLNENQIRFTLTREDLASRRIRLSELAYGSEKARNLFQEMMQMAADEHDFQVNNTPLMIEAIPVSPDSIVLIVTKVDDPDELDNRFSHFSLEDRKDSSSPNPLSGADDILDLIARLSQARKDARDLSAAGNHPRKSGASSKDSPLKGAIHAQPEEPVLAGAPAAAGPSDISPSAPETGVFSGDAGSAQDAVSTVRPQAGSSEASENVPDEIYHLTRFYLFHDMETLIQAAHMTDPSFCGISSLFRNPDDGNYYLILQKANTSPASFNRVCNVLSEFAMPVEFTSGMTEFFAEHMTYILKGDALEHLRVL